MTHIVKIGNSQGIRIPKPLIEQAQLEGKELTLKVLNDGILIAPQHGTRAGWKEAIEQSLISNGPDLIDKEWLDSSLASEVDLEW